MRPSKEILLRILITLPFLVLIGGVMVERVVHYKLNAIMHPAHLDQYGMTFENGQPIQQVHFETVDGLALTGWYIPPPQGVVIILQHGYLANSAEMLPAGFMLRRHGYGVLFFDFRGHGKSEGDTVTLGLFETRDTDAAVDFLLKQPEVNKIGLLGNSMGGATAILAAAKNERVQAVAVEAAYSELKDEVGIGIGAQTPFPASPLDSIFIFVAERETGYRLSEVAPVAEIGKISPRPVLIMQGGNDKRIHADSGEKLFAAAGEPKYYWVEPSAAHVTIFQAAPQEYEKHVVDFFNRYLLDRTSP